MAEFRSKCPECGRTNNPLDADQCSCGYRFDRADVDTSAKEPDPVRITEITLTFKNALGITAQFWFASLLWGLMVGAVGLVVYVVVLFVQTYS